MYQHGILQHRPQDHGWGDGSVVAHSDVTAPDFILLRKAADAGQGFLLSRDATGAGGVEDIITKGQGSPIPDRGGDRFGDQGIDRIETEFRKHSSGFGRIRSEVATWKIVGRVEGMSRSGGV